MYSSTLSLTSALGGWSTPHLGLFTPGKQTRYPLYRRLGGSQGQAVRVWKIFPPLGFIYFMHVLLPKSRKHFSYPSPNHTSHNPNPSHAPSLDYPNDICRGVQITKLHITHFSAVTCYSLSLKMRYLSQHTIGKELSVQIC
jgi:hypothetical protein